MTKQALHTPDAPQAIGTYSQAIRTGSTVYLSGQIGLDPATMQVVEGIDAQIHRVFRNLQAVATAAGASLDVPLGHKDEPWSFPHFDTITVSIPDAPRPDEIVVVIAIADGGRLRNRCGNEPIR